MNDTTVVNHNSRVLHDLIISKAMVEIFQDFLLADELALKGGTALQKLFYSTPSRYSESLELTQISHGKVKLVLDRLQAVLEPCLGKPTIKRYEGQITLIYCYEVNCSLKIEISIRECFTVLGLCKKVYEEKDLQGKIKMKVTTYQLDELLAIKLRQLYLRKKGRDLFDVVNAVRSLKVNVDNVIACFKHYSSNMGLYISRRDFEKNLAQKSSDLSFKNDILPLLTKESHLKPNIDEDVEMIREKLIQLLPGEPWKY